jgi:hypothetical protein
VHTEKYSASVSQNPSHLRQGLGNVHVGKGDGGYNAIERCAGERQRFAFSAMELAFWEALSGNGEPVLVNVNANDFIVRQKVGSDGEIAFATSQVENTSHNWRPLVS